MTMEIRVPQLPESVADATLVAWRKQPGDTVSRDENLADLETDKVVLEVPAPAAGVIKEFKVQPGATVKSGDLLAIFEEGAAAVAPAKGAKSAKSAPVRETAAPAAPAAATTSGAAAKLGPAARRLVEENHVDPATVAGSGRDGRVSKADVAAHVARAAAPAAAPAVAAGPVAVPGARAEQRVPMTRLRLRIAERLLQAQQNAALLTTFNEIDLTAISEIRARHKDRFEKEHGVKLGFMSFFVKAVVEALKAVPQINVRVEGDEIVQQHFYDIGVAVGTERGLIVPVIRDADQKSFADIEKDILAYAAKSKEGKIELSDLTGGVFTISNGGVYGSLLSTPIINPPQSGILGMHSIQQRPIAVDGQVVIRPMMYLALSYDHRVVDGKEAVSFLIRIKDCIENPARMLVGA